MWANRLSNFTLLVMEYNLDKLVLQSVKGSILIVSWNYQLLFVRMSCV